MRCYKTSQTICRIKNKGRRTIFNLLRKMGVAIGGTRGPYPPGFSWYW